MTKIQNRTKGLRAFTMVEVVLALGVAAFTLVSLMGVLPVGLQSYKNANEEITATNLASSIIADIRATEKGAEISPRYGFRLQQGSAPEVRKFDQWQQQTGQPRYRVFTQVLPAESPVQPRRVLITVSWPVIPEAAGADLKPVPPQATGKIETSCYVD